MSSFVQQIWAVLSELSPWLLLGAAAAGLLHVFLPANFVARWLSGRAGVVRAVLLGVPLPLCSCGVIPAGLGLKKDGASNGAAVGFLTATPQTGIDSILVSGSFLGWPFALFKVLSAGLLGITGGLLAERVTDEDTAASSNAAVCTINPSVTTTAQRSSLRRGAAHTLEMLQTIWRWLVFGVLLSAAISTWVPAGSFEELGGGGFVPLLATLAISIPLYVCATASVPIAASLVAGGFPAGSALVFLMAGPATNVATVGAVRKAFGGRVTIVYLLNIVVGSLLLGWGFDFVLSVPAGPSAHVVHHATGPLRITTNVILLGLLSWFAWTDLRSWLKLRAAMNAPGSQAKIELDVDGMNCGGCVKKLTTKLENVPGVDSVLVVLEPRGHASVGGTASEAALRAAVGEAGFIAL